MKWQFCGRSPCPPNKSILCASHHGASGRDWHTPFKKHVFVFYRAFCKQHIINREATHPIRVGFLILVLSDVFHISSFFFFTKCSWTVYRRLFLATVSRHQFKRHSVSRWGRTLFHLTSIFLNILLWSASRSVLNSSNAIATSSGLQPVCFSPLRERKSLSDDTVQPRKSS